MRGSNHQQALRRQVEGIETGAVGRPAFGERHVLGDPAKAGARTRSQPERKAGRGGEMGFARRRYFMQRAARKPAAKRLVDGRNAERKAARIVLDSGGLLEGC
jgi:hypothetical protein